MRHHRLRIDPHRFGPLRSAPLVVVLASLAVGFVFSRQPARAGADFFAAPPDSIPSAGATGSVAAGRLVLVHRVLAQDQGDWQVDYGFKNAGAEAVVLHPRDIAARVEGWLSNSRIAAHANPRRAACVLEAQAAPTAYAEVIASPDEAKRCRERVALWVSSGPADPGVRPALTSAAGPALGSPATAAATARSQPRALGQVTVEPGEVVRVRLRFEHEHAVHGDYDPLLGRRDLELKLGSHTFRDALPLDREQYLAQPKGTWPEPPAERKDARHFVTGPDSLHLDADLIGGNYFQFPERKVRYSTRMRLKFWYRVAPGTEGELHAKIHQYRAGSDYSWKPLADGASDLTLATTGRWVLFEKIIRTEPAATTLILDFRISSSDVGEAWIDDVTLEPADAPSGGP